MSDRQAESAAQATAETTLSLGKSHPPVGARPGTLAIPSDADPPRMTDFLYTAEEVLEHTPSSPRQAAARRVSGKRLWLDVQGIGDEALIRELGEVFSIHPLALEDAVNVPQRPSSQVFEQHHLIIARAVRPRSTRSPLGFEQICLLVGEDLLITVQECHGDSLEPIRQRLRQGGPRIRRGGSDYLAYAILDAVIDAYYRPVEEVGEVIEELERQLLVEPDLEQLVEIHRLKKELLLMRRALWPLREAINSLLREESPWVSDAVDPYLRDCYDHCVQLLDVIETYREHAASLMSTYLSAVGNRTNDVMKVLTIMASVFIPLTFLAGIYGMNFEHIPELETRWGYPALLATMVAIAVGLFFYFRRLGWIGGRGRHPE